MVEYERKSWNCFKFSIEIYNRNITSVNIIVQPVVSGEGDTQDDEAYQRKHQPKPNVPKPPGAPVQTETVVAIHHRDHLKYWNL